MYHLYFASDTLFCVTHAVCQSAVWISILYRRLTVLFFQHRGCTGALERTLQQVLQMAVRKNISQPRCDQLRPTCNNTWQIFKCPYRMLTYQQQLTAGGSLGDTINGPDRFVYFTYCKWRRLYAVCSKLCGVSLRFSLFCIVTVLCIASCKIKKLYLIIIVYSAVIMYRYISRSVIFPVSS